MTLVEAHFAFRVLPNGADDMRRDQAAAIILREVKAAAKRLPSFGLEVLEEAIGETCIKLLKHAPAQPLTSDDHVRAFIYVVLKRTCISILRRSGSQPQSPPGGDEPPDPRSMIGTIDVDETALTSRLAVFAKSLVGVSRSAAFELIAIHEGRISFAEILRRLASTEGMESEGLEKLKARKYKQYSRAKAQLETAISRDRTLNMWDRTLLLYAVGGLGLSNDHE